ncbi:hypothetical protein FKP32DRAFT_1592644 [Trametes sanguinea]|nr:hypothetical protein FKP32DRAFT_1592644 [Trametes sanguinea]
MAEPSIWMSRTLFVGLRWASSYRSCSCVRIACLSRGRGTRAAGPIGQSQRDRPKVERRACFNLSTAVWAALIRSGPPCSLLTRPERLLSCVSRVWRFGPSLRRGSNPVRAWADVHFSWNAASYLVHSGSDQVCWAFCHRKAGFMRIARGSRPLLELPHLMHTAHLAITGESRREEQSASLIGWEGLDRGRGRRCVTFRPHLGSERRAALVAAQDGSPPSRRGLRERMGGRERAVLARELRWRVQTAAGGRC